MNQIGHCLMQATVWLVHNRFAGGSGQSLLYNGRVTPSLTRPPMNIGDRVKFIGPEYKYAAGPFIGQHGTVTARDGHKAGLVGEELIELITAQFDGADRPSNISINRIAYLTPESSTPC